MDGLQGKTVSFLFAWLAQRLQIQEAYIVQENVERVVTRTLEDALGCLYYVDHAILDPFELGWPIARRRKYTILRHKLKTGAMAQPLSSFARLFLRPPCPVVDNMPAWDMFFIAGPRELREELLWAGSRPQSLVREVGEEENEADQPDPFDSSHQGAFWKALTKSERNFLSTYQAMCPGQIYQLNQNPEVTAVISDTNRMFTVIKNAGTLWWLGLHCMRDVVLRWSHAT